MIVICFLLDIAEVISTRNIKVSPTPRVGAQLVELVIRVGTHETAGQAGVMGSTGWVVVDHGSVSCGKISSQITLAQGLVFRWGWRSHGRQWLVVEFSGVWHKSSRLKLGADLL